MALKDAATGEPRVPVPGSSVVAVELVVGAHTTCVELRIAEDRLDHRERSADRDTVRAAA